jgi:hypothetical protein
MTITHTEIVGLCGLVISLTSIWLQWDLQQRLSNIEDRLKDGRITGEQAMQKIRFWKYFAPALSLTGVILLGIAALGFLS